MRSFRTCTLEMSGGFGEVIPSTQQPVTSGDMSLQKNVAGQNFTFALLNVTNDTPLTGASVVGFTSKDGGSQASTGGTFTELTPTGNGIYNYAPTQAETNGNCVSFYITATNAVPFNLMFLTGGLHKNVASQHVTFGMISQAGVADPSATVTVEISKDGSSLSSGSGTTTNLGNGQYDYAPTQSETNGTMISFTFTASGDITQNVIVFTVP